MKRTILYLVALILMLCSASALAASSDEALITDILRQADITQPVQLSQWDDAHGGEIVRTFGMYSEDDTMLAAIG